MTAHAMEASSAWVMDLAATLLAKETATASVDALVAVMRVRSRRFRDVFGAFFLLPRTDCFFLPVGRVDTPVGRLVFCLSSVRRPFGPARVSLMIRRIPCQDSDELLLVELRVETFSSAAFLLRDARDALWGAFFPTRRAIRVSIFSHPRSFDEYTRWRNTAYSWRSSTISSLTRGTH